MGLIGWIKKEIESTHLTRQRRQSAPPPVTQCVESPDLSRDEAYMKAISKFNEWRTVQRFEKVDETTEATVTNDNGVGGSRRHDKSGPSDSTNWPSDVECNDVEKKLLKCQKKLEEEAENPRVLKHSAILSNLTPDNSNKVKSERSKRYSLPNFKSKSNGNKDASFRRKNKQKANQNNNTIYEDEIHDFEENHCQDGDQEMNYSYSVKSPPSKFYRENSDPYFDKKNTPESREATPKRSLGKNFMKKGKSYGKSKAPAPPTSAVKSATIETESIESNNFNGNFKHYEVNSSSIYDEYIISSKAYKGIMRKPVVAPINSLGETSSTSNSPEPTTSAIKKKKLRRFSPPYQTVINKHGQEVEYALPYNEQDSPVQDISLPPLPETPVQSHFDQIINENFQFLNSKIGEDSLLNRRCIGELDPIETFLERRSCKDVQVTDLDRSNETGLGPAYSGDIMKELESLEQWSRNVEVVGKGKFQLPKTTIEDFQLVQNNIRVFNSNEIRYKSSELRNSFPIPLEFSTGYFQSTPVTLRKTLPIIYNIHNYAEEACKHEFEILSVVKHASTVILMGICFDDILRQMSLVMEPFDYTLNHYLHQMDKQLGVEQIIIMLQQVASATQYLHECGLIHSNISSHAVLIRGESSQFTAKLSCFELTTEILPRDGLAKVFHPKRILKDNAIVLENEIVDEVLKEKYYKLSKQHFYNRNSMISTTGNDIINSKQLPYCIEYRRNFSLHYYQSPELLLTSNRSQYIHVLPTVQSDAFGLALLLWEAVNCCVPFVTHSDVELEKSYAKNKAHLPQIELETCQWFEEIFESCLKVNANERISDITKLLKMLEEIQAEFTKIGTKKIVDEKPAIKRAQQEVKKNFKPPKMTEKVQEKMYFRKQQVGRVVRDPQLRSENAITTHNLNIAMRHQDSKISDSFVSKSSMDIEPNILSNSNCSSWINQQPGILLETDALDRIKQFVSAEKIIAPKKPSRKKSLQTDEDLPIPIIEKSIGESTLYQSFFNFNQLYTPKADKDAIYERTSTLKKRIKAPGAEGAKKSVKELFEEPKKNADNRYGKINNELNSINGSFNKSDFLTEVVKELHQRKRQSEDHEQEIAVKDTSKSFDDLRTPAENKNSMKRCESIDTGNITPSNSYRFTIGDFSLPNTPIARQNKIRRNAWLSDQKQEQKRKTYGNKNSESVNNSPKVLAEGSGRKQFNVNIKIHHNDLEQKLKQSNLLLNNHNDSINIKISPSVSGSGFKINNNVNNIDANESVMREHHQEDINKKYYPNMPELFSDAIQKSRWDRSGFLQMSQQHIDEQQEQEENNLRFEQNLWHRELSLCQQSLKKSEEEKVIVPVRTSVREAVKFIESTYSSNSSPSRPRSYAESPRVQDSSNMFFTPAVATPNNRQHINESTTKTELFYTPNGDKVPEADDVSECLMQASESIQKLNVILKQQQQQNQEIPQQMPKIINKRMENVASSSTITTTTLTPKKITTKVTVNLKKISRRSSDVGLLKQTNEQGRHSICNNAELIKRISMHLKKKAGESFILEAGNEGSSCMIQTKDQKVSECQQNQQLQQGKRQKYFCRNCGFTMIPTDLLLQQLQNSGRLSIASTLADSLLRIDENGSAVKCCGETKSTEDLYIDDDFCQGIQESLAANMELLPPPEYGLDFFGSIDFNILTAEIFHTQEHDFSENNTLIDDEIKRIEGIKDVEQEEKGEEEEEEN